MDYSKVQVGPEGGKGYKRFFGGGEAGWVRRGEFQVEFLKSRGLASDHRLADIGCGPLRAGAHFIRFLEADRYVGVDYNADFIEEAQRLVRSDPALRDKRPSLRVVQDFDLGALGAFDFVILFSVLNHVSPEGRAAFFRQLPALMHDQTRLFISHATWLSAQDLPNGLNARFLHQLTGPLDTAHWGWPAGESIFPIVEISAASVG